MEASKLKTIENNVEIKDFSIWGEITQDIFEAFEDVPSEFIGFARITLAGLKADGQIEDFIIYEAEFMDLWQSLVEKKGVRDCHFLIASGFPKIPQVSVRVVPPAEQKNVVRINFDPKNGDMAKIKPDWIVHKINAELAANGVKARVDGALVHGAWLKATRFKIDIRDLDVDLHIVINQNLTGRDLQIDFHPEFGCFITRMSKLAGNNPEECYYKIQEKLKKTLDRISLTHHCSGLLLHLNEHIRAQINLAFQGRLHCDMGGTAHFLSAMIIPPKFTYENYISVVTRDVSNPEIQTHGFVSESMILANVLNDAEQALAKQDYHHRDMQTMIITVNEDRIGHFAEIIKGFKKSFLSLIDQGPKENLYILGFQFFPLTKLNAEPGNPKHQNDKLSKEWCNIVIREMIGLNSYHTDPEWVVNKLYPPTTVEEVSQVHENLSKMGQIRREGPTGRWQIVNKNVHIETPKGEKVKAYHQCALELGKQSLHWRKNNRGTFFAIAYEGNELQKRQVTALYMEFLGKLFETAGHGTGRNQIYQVNLQHITSIR